MCPTTRALITEKTDRRGTPTMVFGRCGFFFNGDENLNPGAASCRGVLTKKTEQSDRLRQCFVEACGADFVVGCAFRRCVRKSFRNQMAKILGQTLHHRGMSVRRSKVEAGGRGPTRYRFVSGPPHPDGFP